MSTISIDISWDGPQFPSICLCRCILLQSMQNIDSSWDGLQFLCICLCRCLHSTFLLCFTRFERMRGNNSDFLGAPTANKYLVITIKCGLGSFLWGSALTYGFRTHPNRTDQSALASTSMRNECWVYPLETSFQASWSRFSFHLRYIVCPSLLIPPWVAWVRNFFDGNFFK